MQKVHMHFKRGRLLAKALKQALDDIHWNKLRAVRWVYAKARAHGWSRASVYPYIHRMFSGISNTKTWQEDILQDLTNPARASRKKDISMTRAFFCMATSERLNALPTRVVRLVPGELAIHGKTHNVVADNFNPRPSKALLSPEPEVFRVATHALKTGDDKD